MQDTSLETIAAIGDSIATLQKQRLALISAYIGDQLKKKFADFPELVELAGTFSILTDETFQDEYFRHTFEFTLGKEPVTKLWWYYRCDHFTLMNPGYYTFSWYQEEEEKDARLQILENEQTSIDILLWCRLAESLKIAKTPAKTFIAFINDIVCYDTENYIIDLLNFENDWGNKEAELPMSQYGAKLLKSANFRSAVKKGDFLALKPLLDDLSPNATADKQEILTLAIKYGHIEIVRALLKDPLVAELPESRDAEKYTYQGAVNYNRSVLKTTLLDNFSPDVTAAKIELLMFIIESCPWAGTDSIAKAILQDPLIDSATKMQAFKKAQRRGSYLSNIIAEILQCLDVDVMIAFEAAIREGRANDAELLTQNSHFDQSYDGHDLCVTAAGRNHVDCVKILLKNKSWTVPEKSNLFMNAVLYLRLPLIELLLQDGRFDPTVNNNYALKYVATKAVNSGNFSVLKTLLQDPRVDPSDLVKAGMASCLQTAELDRAVANGNLQAVEELLRGKNVIFSK